VKHAIIEKLERELRDPIDTEPKVVYVLCEIRKLLEKDGLGRARKDLRLFCDWALHVDLDRPGTTKHFLERIDEVLTNYFEHPPTGETISIENALFKELAYFGTFRAELREALRSYGLPTDLCDNNVRWAKFLLAYTSVIEDGTLTANLRWVSGARFTIDPRVSFTDAHLPVEMVWVITLTQPYKGYSTFEVSVLGTADGRMVASGFGLGELL
jgi:hypothetical protein